MDDQHITIIINIHIKYEISSTLTQGNGIMGINRKIIVFKKTIIQKIIQQTNLSTNGHNVK